MKVHLCCGLDNFPGWLNVDAINFGFNTVADLGKEWTFAEPGTVDYILCKDGFEHMDSPEHFLAQAAKVLKPGGVLELWVPHYKNPSAYRITHKTYYSWNLFSVYPEPHDKVKLKVISNRLYIGRKESAVFAPLHWLINLCPKWWERLFYASNVEVCLQREA